MTELTGCCIERIEKPDWDYMTANFIAGSLLTCYIEGEESSLGSGTSGKEDLDHKEDCETSRNLFFPSKNSNPLFTK